MSVNRLSSVFPFWGEVYESLVAAARRIPSARLDERVLPGRRTIRQIFEHLGEVYQRDIHEFVLGHTPTTFTTRLTRPTRHDLIRRLEQEWHDLEAFLDTADAEVLRQTKPFGAEQNPRTYADALWNVLMEQLHHRGQIFMLMAHMGVPPPEN